MNQHGAAGDPVRLADCTSALENVYLSICAVGKVTIAIPVGVSTNAGTVGVVVATLSAMDDNLGILVIVEGFAGIRRHTDGVCGQRRKSTGLPLMIGSEKRLMAFAS